jgi:hypothetical protein
MEVSARGQDERGKRSGRMKEMKTPTFDKVEE